MIEPLAIDPRTITKPDRPRPEGEYELPGEVTNNPLVTWDEVKHDVIEYSFFFKDHKMWSQRSRSVKEDGKSKDIKYFKEVANFSMQVVVHMRDQRQAMRLVEMTNSWGASVHFDTSSDSFSSKMLFCKTTESYGNFLFEGNDTDLIRLKRKLMNEMGSGKAVTVLGWQKRAKAYFFNNCAVDIKGRVHEYDPTGMIKIGGTTHYVQSANAIYEDDETRFEPQKRFIYIDEGITFESAARMIHLVHGEHALLFLPWAVANCFHDHIFKDRHFFPIYFMYGHPSTGKGKLCIAGMSFYGEPQKLTTVTGSNTDKAKIRKMAQFRNAIGGFDEYSVRLPDPGQKAIQGYWDGHGYERATMDGSVNTESVPIRSGAVVLSNDYPIIDALVTRCIIDPFLIDKFTKEQQTNYELLNEMMAKGYSGALREIIMHREAFEKEWLACWTKARADVKTHLALEPGIVGRMLDNLACVLAVRWFFDKRLTWPFTYDQVLYHGVELMKRQNSKRDTGGSVAQFWECIRRAVKEEDLVLGEDFRIDGDEFVISWSSSHNAYLKMHRTMYGGEGDGKHVMADKLKNSPAFVKVRERDIRMAGVKVYGFQFKASALADLISDLGAERAKKYRKQQHVPEPMPY